MGERKQFSHAKGTVVGAAATRAMHLEASAVSLGGCLRPAGTQSPREPHALFDPFALIRVASPTSIRSGLLSLSSLSCAQFFGLSFEWSLSRSFADAANSDAEVDGVDFI